MLSNYLINIYCFDLTERMEELSLILVLVTLLTVYLLHMGTIMYAQRIYPKSAPPLSQCKILPYGIRFSNL